MLYLSAIFMFTVFIIAFFCIFIILKLDVFPVQQYPGSGCQPARRHDGAAEHWADYFNWLILTGLVKGANRIVKEKPGLQTCKAVLESKTIVFNLKTEENIPNLSQLIEVFWVIY